MSIYNIVYIYRRTRDILSSGMNYSLLTLLKSDRRNDIYLSTVRYGMLYYIENE